MKNRDKKKGLERQSKTENPKETETLMKRYLSHLIFWCCCCHGTKVKKQGKKEQQKKQERSQKTKQQGRKKKKQEKNKRERVSKKEKWMKPRRKKGRHREMNNDNPLSGGKQCSCKQRNKKKPKEKKGIGPTAPKHVQGLRWPQTQEENAEKSKTRKEERGASRAPFEIRKNGVERRTPKN